jgi:hypothetical protein
VATIFISYTHKDEASAKLIKKFLNKRFENEVTIFLACDPIDISPGEKWLPRILEELKTTKVLIALLSRTAKNKPWIHFEAGAAHMVGANILPVCLGGLSKAKMWPRYFSDSQALPLANAWACYELERATAKLLGRQPPDWPGRFPDAGNESAKRPYRQLANAIRELGHPSLKAGA